MQILPSLLPSLSPLLPSPSPTILPPLPRPSSLIRQNNKQLLPPPSPSLLKIPKTVSITTRTLLVAADSAPGFLLAVTAGVWKRAKTKRRPISYWRSRGKIRRGLQRATRTTCNGWWRRRGGGERSVDFQSRTKTGGQGRSVGITIGCRQQWRDVFVILMDLKRIILEEVLVSMPIHCIDMLSQNHKISDWNCSIESI